MEFQSLPKNRREMGSDSRLSQPGLAKCHALTVATTAIYKAPLCDWFELGGEVAQGLRLLDHSIPRQGGSIFGDRSDDLNHIVNMALGIGSPRNRQSD